MRESCSRVFPILGAVAYHILLGRSDGSSGQADTAQTRFSRAAMSALCPMGDSAHDWCAQHISNLCQAERQKPASWRRLQVVGGGVKPRRPRTKTSQKSCYEQKRRNSVTNWHQIGFCSRPPTNAPLGLDAIRFLEKEFVEYSLVKCTETTSDSRLIPANWRPCDGTPARHRVARLD